MTTFEEIEASLPWGLHDAYLEALDVDWMAARMRVTVRAMISERQDMDRRARITLDGLVFCVIDGADPTSRPERVSAPAGLWIDSGTGDAGKRLPPVPSGCFVHWLFVRDWNAFIHVCACAATFEWLEPVAVPARAETRALYAGDEAPDPE